MWEYIYIYTGIYVPEKRQPRYSKSGESGCAKPNHNSSNIKILGRWMNTEIAVDVNDVYKVESVFSRVGNAEFSTNMFYVSINKPTNLKCGGGNISVFENPSRR